MEFSLYVNEDILLKLPDLWDVPEIFSLVDQNRLYLRKYLPWVDQNASEGDSETFVKECHSNYENGTGFSLCIIYQDSIAGMIGFHYLDKLNKKTEIGYWLAENLQKKGIMHLSCQKMIEYAFHELHMHRIEIRAEANNLPSQRIPKRLGFTYEGRLRESMMINDTFIDIDVYSLLSNDQRIFN